MRLKIAGNLQSQTAPKQENLVSCSSMLSAIKQMIPRSLKERAVLARKAVRYELRRRRFTKVARTGYDLKIILGAAETYQDGWYATNEQWFDITRPEHWHRLFGDRQPLKSIVAEHVFEHLTPEGAETAFQQAVKYLQPGGTIRIAVPDGNHPDPEYMRHVGIAGIGPDAADHKQLYTAESLMKQMQTAGLNPTHLEGYTADQQLVARQVDPTLGFIKRSRTNQNKSHPDNWDFPDASTSLVVDGTKLTK